VNTQTIEQLTAIVNDASRPEKERKEAAQLILSIGQPAPAPVVEPDDVVSRLKRSFDMLLAQDRHRDFDAEERARVANLKAIEPEPKPKPAEIVPEPKQSTVADQVKAASRLCDIELVKLEEKIAALKAETGG
jgi:hypothetical protein